MNKKRISYINNEYFNGIFNNNASFIKWANTIIWYYKPGLKCSTPFLCNITGGLHIHLPILKGWSRLKCIQIAENKWLMEEVKTTMNDFYSVNKASHMICLRLGSSGRTLAPGREWWRLFQIQGDALITFSSWPSQNNGCFCSRWMESILPALFTADPGLWLLRKHHACISHYEIFITWGGEMRDGLIFHHMLKLYYCCVTKERKKGSLNLQLCKTTQTSASSRDISLSQKHFLCVRGIETVKKKKRKKFPINWCPQWVRLHVCIQNFLI